MTRLLLYAFRVMAILLGLLVVPANAHDSRPFSVLIEQQQGQAYLVRLRIPPTVDFDNRPRIAWPNKCRELNDRTPQGAFGEARVLLLRCSQTLEGQTIAISYPVYNPSLPTLFRLKRSDGSVITQLLGPDELEWQIPREPGWLDVAQGYLLLGIEHIWSGIDHLLFVAGLLILGGSFRRVLVAVTGFTVAHSVTLSLSALGLVRLPVAPVEAAIALSILFLAREIAVPHPDGLARRFPIAVSTSFGLLHGFGFAAALQDAGLPKSDLATGLLCFNLGVEIGQIAFILLAVGAFLAARALLARWPVSRQIWMMKSATMAGYALGIPAAYWFIERLGAALA